MFYERKPHWCIYSRPRGIGNHSRRFMRPEPEEEGPSLRGRRDEVSKKEFSAWVRPLLARKWANMASYRLGRYDKRTKMELEQRILELFYFDQTSKYWYALSVLGKRSGNLTGYEVEILEFSALNLFKLGYDEQLRGISEEGNTLLEWKVEDKLICIVRIAMEEVKRRIRRVLNVEVESVMTQGSFESWLRSGLLDNEADWLMRYLEIEDAKAAVFKSFAADATSLCFESELWAAVDIYGEEESKELDETAERMVRFAVRELVALDRGEDLADSLKSSSEKGLVWEIAGIKTHDVKTANEMVRRIIKEELGEES